MIRGMFADVINQSIAAGYLIAAVIVARLLLKKAPKSVSCILWLLVGVRLLMPFSFVSVFSLIPSGMEVRESITELTGQGIADGNGASSALDSAPVSNTGYIDEEMIWASGIDNASEESVNRPYVYFTIASVIWLLGIGVMLLYLAVSWMRIASRVRFAIPAEQDGVKYYRCETIDAPFLFGFFKSRIYVPSDLNGEELDYVLKHETVHRQRKDYLTKPAGYLILALHWFNPLVWAAYLLLCRDIELACDERVLQEIGGEHKREYASALLTCSVNRKGIAACPVAFGETGVKGRIKNVLNYKKPTLWVIVTAVAVVAVVAVCFMTDKVEVDMTQGQGGTRIVTTNPANAQGRKEGMTISPAKEETDDAVYQQELLSQRAQKLEAQQKAMQEEAELLARKEQELEAQQKAIQEQLARTNEVNEYVTQWAEAFCSRDGKTLAAMIDASALDTVADTLGMEQGVDDHNEPYAAFGWSSPWPWDSGEDAKNYRIVSASDKGAVILYYAWVSNPHVTVWREDLSYTIKDGEFKVTSQSIQFLDAICVAEEFYKAYPDGVINNTPMDYYAYNGAGEALNDNSKNPNMAQGAYAGLDAPDTAAIELLNLLRNENKITTDVEYTNKEQTEAVVTFTFKENASTAKVRMIKPYGEDSIWLPQTY